MKSKKIAATMLLGALIYSLLSMPVYADGIPSFPSCLNPQGTLKAKYDNGTHGIVGDTRVYTGRDEVYTVSDNTAIQCFCPDNGNGIQTNWWKTENFDVNQIKSYQSQGWILVPNGESWGLSSAQYMAKNFNYYCLGGGTGGGELGIGQVLALASTGNVVFIYATAFLGVALLAGGIIALSRNNKRS